MKKKHLSALALATALFAVSCSDDLSNEQNVNRGDRVSYDLNTNTPAVKKAPATRSGAQEEELATWSKIETTDSNGEKKYILQITEDNTQQLTDLIGTDAETRAVSSSRGVEADYTTFAYRGTVSGALNYGTQWFLTTAKKSGQLNSFEAWDKNEPIGKFYGIYPTAEPTNGITKLVYTGAEGSPKFHFAVNDYVDKQVSLMTAVSDEQTYTGGIAAPVPMKFYNALTSVRFMIDDDLVKDHVITRISIQRVYSEGDYAVGSKADHSESSWSGQKTQKTYTLIPSTPISTNGQKYDVLTGSKVTTAEVEAGATDDNYTFMMVPQTVPSNAQIVIDLQSTKTNATSNITFSIAGHVWKEGKNANYLISNNWTTEIFTVTPPTQRLLTYQGGQTGTYSVRSYRLSSGRTFEPLAWEVEKYEEFDGATGKDASNTSDWTDLGTTAPTWLNTTSSFLSGTGSATTTTSEQGTITLNAAAIIDHMKPYNDDLKNATPAVNRDLSMWDQAANSARSSRSTANTYLISAPGTYKIPLVYGNAITNGNTIESAYHVSSAAVAEAQAKLGSSYSRFFLPNFVDHTSTPVYTGDPTKDPWITSKYAIDGAVLIWEDVEGIINQSSFAIENGTNGSTNSFVKFEVPQDKIKNGNAVIAVKSGNTIVWSWNLWFAKRDELQTKAVVNLAGITYNMAVRNIGWTEKYDGTSYTQNRQVRITVKQTATGKTQQFVITQTPHAVRGIWDSKFQWGRKDAFPGTATDVYNYTHSDASYAGTAEGLGQTIANPGTMNTSRSTNFYNLWSADNAVTTVNDVNENTVIKTIYDPSPAGYKIPASAFTGFTTTGNDVSSSAQINASDNTTAWVSDGSRNNGYNFYTNSSKSATIFFPASGYRYYDGRIANVGNRGYVWRAGTNDRDAGHYLDFKSGGVGLENGYFRYIGFSVRPVLDN